ncbi:MAG: MarR family transcriptional regulator [Bacteroidales bacterium]|nr:MarR family transcriptional regulator [Bacteroidales bacterium]
METKDLVFQILKESPKPLKSGEIAMQSGIEKAQVDKAIQALKKEEKIISPKVCFYTAK